MKLSNIPLRLVTGAFILNSGIGKLDLDGNSAAGLQGMASNAIPEFKDMKPETFGKFISYSEIAVGSALLFPAVPARLAGLALGAFSAGLLTMYFRTEGMTQSDGIRPSQQGTAVAKDVWMAGIAASLLIGGGKRR
ncbi:hypothetical protein V6N00_12000 [Tersicoccus sp. MR15.9]|uniref:hypothetical protein n=1 Tax=Tersicoccus mangrovi TaxID=3121635 RepID=UPI002FE68E25